MRRPLVDRDPGDEQTSLDVIHPCPDCNGTGRQPLTNDACPYCHATGQVLYDPNDNTIPF